MKRDVTVFLRLGVTFAGVEAADEAGCVALALERAEVLMARDMFRATPGRLAELSAHQPEPVIYSDAAEPAGAMADESFAGDAHDPVWYDAGGRREGPAA